VSEAVAGELGRRSAEAIPLGGMLLEAQHESENGYQERQLRANAMLRPSPSPSQVPLPGRRLFPSACIYPSHNSTLHLSIANKQVIIQEAPNFHPAVSKGPALLSFVLRTMDLAAQLVGTAWRHSLAAHLGGTSWRHAGKTSSSKIPYTA
jgi:hypothetical protein